MKNALQRQQNIMAVTITQDAAVASASYEICFIPRKYMKLFTNAEIVK